MSGKTTSMIKSRWILIIVLLAGYWMPLCSQSVADQKVSVTVKDKPLITVLYQLHKKYNIEFFFDPDDIAQYNLVGRYEEVQLYKILQAFTNGSSILVIPRGKEGVILAKKEKINKDYIESLIRRWRTGELKYPIDDRAEEYTFTFPQKGSRLRDEYTLKINLVDKITKEPIVGAVLQNEDFSVSDASDLRGRITLRLPPGSKRFIISYIGYKPINMDVDLYRSAEIDLELSVQDILLTEIEIIGSGGRAKLNDTKIGAETIDLAKIERIPQALGEVDIIKSLEILPGVTSVGDISSGFNVRGGNVDESLVLYNDGMIFNPTHIVGFISAFNAEAISSTTLYKGYVDGELGNRSSAILDITADARNVKKKKITGGIGTSMVKLHAENAHGKLKYKVSGRCSFNDYLLSQVSNVEIQRSNASFWDLNSSIAYDITKQHSIVFNTYNSDDFFEFNDEFGFEWQNGHLGLKLNSKWNDRLFSKLSLNRGSYGSNQFTLGSAQAGSFKTGIDYAKVLLNTTLQWNDEWYIKAGAEFIDYDAREDELIPAENSALNPASIQRKSARTLAPFVTARYKPFNSLSIEASLRYSNYLSLGPGRIHLYNQSILSEQNIESKVDLAGVDDQGSYAILEPRFSINYKLASNFSLRGGYNRMSQNVMQVTTASSALPSDFWVFSDRYTPPQVSNQLSIGVVKTNDGASYNISVETFYKTLTNTRSLKNFPNVILNEHLETELLSSEGNSYGLELLMEKNQGRWKGSFAYTYSRSLRRTIAQNGSLNNGDWFPADFDIPHQLNLVASYQWLPPVSLQFSYVYKSGRPTSLPVGSIIQDDLVIPIYSAKNQARIPYYSRLDFSITLDMRKSSDKGFRNSFNLGFYNVLGRDNAFNVFFRRTNGGNIKPFQFSIIGALVPNFTWNFTF